MSDKVQFIEAMWKQVITLLTIALVGAALVIIFSLAAHLMGDDQALYGGLVKFSAVVLLFCGPFYVFLRFIRSILLRRIFNSSE